MTIFNTYRQYILIFSLSLLLGLIRWSILDRNFPLISKPNIIVDEFINFNDFKDVVDNNSYPIVDARDFYSYEEGFIGNAYNLDIDLIIDFIADTNTVKKRIMERSRIENRSDDNLEVIKTRLDKYFAETQPLAVIFKERFKDKFFEINATQEITKIQYDIENKLKNAQI